MPDARSWTQEFAESPTLGDNPEFFDRLDLKLANSFSADLHLFGQLLANCCILFVAVAETVSHHLALFLTELRHYFFKFKKYFQIQNRPLRIPGSLILDERSQADAFIARN